MLLCLEGGSQGETPDSEGPQQRVVWPRKQPVWGQRHCSREYAGSQASVTHPGLATNEKAQWIHGLLLLFHTGHRKLLRARLLPLGWGRSRPYRGRGRPGLTASRTAAGGLGVTMRQGERPGPFKF